MDTNLIVFLILAFIAVASALGMLLNKNAVYAALFLILNFATVAVFYLILGAPFIALTQITVYAGAIMVLFLFVIMLLGAEELLKRKKFDWQRPIALALAIILIVEAGFIIFGGGQDFAVITAVAEDYGSPQEIGRTLFQEYLIPFEITGFLLLAAMVGAVVITKRKKPEKVGDQPSPLKEE
ncbi:MAG: NADH-quinone oxidoreductase subunit J [Anaerolineales bacterium]|jgi:NADH-quinone oxidoreductase subunit J